MRVASLWREKFGKYNLTGSKCAKCNKLHFPRTIFCDCGSTDIEDFTFSGKGKVYANTVVRVAPAGFGKDAPYAVAVVKLDEGPMITSQVVGTDPETIKIGDRVVMTFRKIIEDGKTGIIHYGYKFRVDNG